MGPTWHRLSYEGSTEIFLKVQLHDDRGYSAYLTDLVTVWYESLTESEVIKRAEELGSPVTQISNILQTIQSSLENNKSSETVSIVREGQHMNLSLSSSLSAVIRFRWKFYLSLNPSLLGEHVIWPLMCSSFLQDQKVADLIKVIKMKDHILSKIKDNSSTNGVDLSNLLPGAGRRAAARHDVPGLEPFDEEAWTGAWAESPDKVLPFRLSDAAAVALREASTVCIENMVAQADSTIQAPRNALQDTSITQGSRPKESVSSRYLQNYEHRFYARLSPSHHQEPAVHSDSTVVDEVKTANSAETAKPYDGVKKVGGIGRLKRRTKDAGTGRPPREQLKSDSQGETDSQGDQVRVTAEDAGQNGPTIKHVRLGKVGRQNRLAQNEIESRTGIPDSSADRSDHQPRDASSDTGMGYPNATQKTNSKHSTEAVSSTAAAESGDSKDHIAAHSSAEPILIPRKKKRRF